jgi:outer membrane protein assembly factor BamA
MQQVQAQIFNDNKVRQVLRSVMSLQYFSTFISYGPLLGSAPVCIVDVVVQMKSYSILSIGRIGIPTFLTVD